VRTLLQRRLNRTDALAIALGGVIGVGVFRTTGLVLAGAGGVGGATALWLAIGAICLCGALLYGDLAARVPEVGGPYAYVRVAFGDLAAFTYGWFDAGIAIPVRQASVMAVIGEVLAGWFPALGAHLLALIVLVVLTALNLLGVHAGAVAQRIFTSGKLLTLGFAIALALWAFGSDGHAVAGIPVAAEGVSFAAAVAGVWYTYLGWQDVVLLAEEVERPQRALPFVLVATVGIVLVIYTGLHLAIYAGLGGGTAAASQLPVSALAGHVLGAGGVTLLAGLMLASMIGGAAEGLMVRPRMALALARDGFGPRWPASVGRSGTPTGALLANSAVVLLLVATGTFGELLPLLVFAQGLLGVFETTSYFIVRRRRSEWPTMRFHPWAPLVFIAANVGLCIVEGLRDPLRAGLAVAALAALAAGFAFFSSDRRVSTNLE
jgi:APA family basic amino acid/polyamine antiporter